MSPDFHMKKIDNSSSVSPSGGDHKRVQLSLDLIIFILSKNDIFFVKYYLNWGVW